MGKSTLFNAFLDQRLSIVTSKAQTTRCSIRGILSRADSQLIFLDTPGLLEPNSLLHETMGRQIDWATRDADVILLLVDASRPDNRKNLVKKFINQTETTVICALNKIDLLPKKKRSKTVSDVAAELGVCDLKTVSAVSGENVTELLVELESTLPLGPRLYPEDIITEQPERFFAGEIVREAAFEKLGDELPYAIAVEVEKFVDPQEDNSLVNGTKKTYVSAVLYVERESQKGIVIGNRGSMLKQIGQQARSNIEELLDRKIYLDLWVKVRPNWRNRERDLKQFGYE